MSNAATDTGLVQPDYNTKPITALVDVVLKAISFVNKGANGKRFFLFKNEDGLGNSDELSGYSPLIKQYNPASNDWEVAYCVIAEPNVVDKQKDVWTEDEIRKSAHEFIANGGLLNWMHETMDSVGQLAESAIALTDMEIETPDGQTETIKKGSWYIAVRPNQSVKKMMQSGEVTGMSVQGSARREAIEGNSLVANGVEKSDKDMRAIPRGAGGEGIKRVQHILGVEETEEYDDATEEAIKDWMAKRGTPGIPTIATLKMLLNEQPAVAPVEAAPVAPEVPEAPASVAAPVEEAEKHSGAAPQPGQPYNPANNMTDAYPTHPNVKDGVNVGPQPGNMGLRATDISVDSAPDDLKAALAQSLQEGNEALAAHMEEHVGGTQVGDLYGRNISHSELWFMYSKFVGGARPNFDLEGNMVEGGAGEVDKGAWTGSMGGHDPDAHNGNMENLVRTFGQWANGSQAVAAKKLLANGVVKTPEAANRLAAWLKDQHLGTTKWRGVHKEDVDLTKVEGLLSDKSEHPAEQSVAAEEVVEPAPDKNGETLKRVAAIIRAGGSNENVMAQISEALKNKPAGMEGALGALKTAIARAAQAPEGEREEMIESIVEDFSRYLAHHTKKGAVAKSADTFSATPVVEDAPANPTNSPLGEEMDRAYIEENREKLAAAAEFITSILDGASSDEVPAEVEKDAAMVAEEPKKKPFPPAAEEGAEEHAADAPVEKAPEEAPDAPEAADAPDLDEGVKDELADEGEDVTEDELIQVLNHVVETLDTLEDRVAQLETLEKKLDQVGELAKALDVTGQIEVLNTTVTELSKSLETVVSSEELEAVKKSLEEVAATPAPSSAIPFETAPAVVAREVETVAKSDISHNDPASIWGGTFR